MIWSIHPKQNGKTTLREVTEKVVNDIESHALNVISDRIAGHFTAFHALDLAFTLNRFRGFDVTNTLSR